MTSYGWVVLEWTDELLTWNATETGVHHLVYPAKELWVPEVGVLNTVEEGRDLGLDENFRVRVDPDGRAHYVPSHIFRTSCVVNLYYFPVDVQNCSVCLLAWVHTIKDIDYNTQFTKPLMSNYEKNNMWRLTNAELKLTKRPRPGEGNFNPMMCMHLELTRIPGYYLLNMVAPCLLMSCMSLLVFLLPADSGEKISLGVTAMLSYTVVLLMVTEVAPKDGKVIPLLTWYIVLMMMITGCSLAATVLVLSVYHRRQEQEVPNWVRKLVLFYLAKGVRMYNAAPANAIENIPDGGKKKGNDMDIKGEGSPGGNSEVRLVDSASMAKEDERGQHQGWQRVGEIIDRCFLIFFLLVDILITCVILFLAVTGDKKKLVQE